MAKIPIALQLYSVREDCAQDFPTTVGAVARMGYEGVEFAGYYGRTAPELRKMLDDLGLKCCGTHIGLETLMGDALKETIEFNQILGNKFLIVPGLAEQYRNSRQAWTDTARIFNELVEKVKGSGMYVGYHNHMIEFQPMDGELPWDSFFGNTVKDVVMQFDTGNALHGGATSAPFIQKYPGRALTVHLKEFSSTNDVAVIGEGDVNWKEVFTACETVGGTQWYIVEQERYGMPPLVCVEKCLQALRAMGK